jgi:hypothetical protein
MTPTLTEVLRELRGAVVLLWFRVCGSPAHHHVYDSNISFGTDQPRGRDTEFLWCRCGALKVVSR